MYYLGQQFLNGLHTGALYALLAFGYALTNGVLHRTNLAYGALFAFGGQVTILLATFGWFALVMTWPAAIAFGIACAFAYAVLASRILSRHVLLPLAERTPNAVVMATLGVSIVLMETARIAADTKDFWLSPMLATPVTFATDGAFAVTLTLIQLIDMGVIASILAASAWIVAATRYGRIWRAVSDDPRAARLCGVDVERTFHASVLAGILLATVGGILAALYFGNVSFGTGMVFGLKVLFITAVGGYRAPIAAAGGAMIFGIGEALWSGYFPIEWRDAWMFIALVMLLVLRADDRTV